MDTGGSRCRSCRRDESCTAAPATLAAEAMETATGVKESKASKFDDKNTISIEALPIKRALKAQCKRMHLTHARPVQTACIPHILKGEDVYAAAKTGSGKTAAFALPIIDRLMEDPFGIFAVVLTPTRELAYQIGDQFHAFGRVANLRHCVITGGVDIIMERNQLARRPHVVIATPGRLAAHIKDSADIDFS
eukprot:gene10703-2803_t